jgi:hypothetical protein
MTLTKKAPQQNNTLPLWLSVIMLSVVFFIVMLNVDMLNVVMLCVNRLNVVAHVFIG